MNLILLVFMLSNIFSFSKSFIDKSLVKCIDSKKLRNILHDYTNDKYLYIPYTKIKKIIHEEINCIDIYGNENEKDDKNIEHIFPQYYFKENILKKEMKSDIHNLYLCNSKLNLYRQNFKYVDYHKITINDNDKLLDIYGNVLTDRNDIFTNKGFIMVSSRKTKRFAPAPYSRGKVARSLGYFAIKYNYVKELQEVIDIDTLIKWNLEDPVDSQEYYKNMIGYKHQNNLNPYILNNELLVYSFLDYYNTENLENVRHRTSYIDPLFSIEKIIK
jgi:endonuclease I